MGEGRISSPFTSSLPCDTMGPATEVSISFLGEMYHEKTTAGFGGGPAADGLRF